MSHGVNIVYSMYNIELQIYVHIYPIKHAVGNAGD